MTTPGIVLCDDLIFFSRIAGAARAAGLAVRQAKTPAAAIEAAKREPPGGVILDLHAEGLDLPAFLAALREICPAMPRTIAFGSHVAAETLRAARQAGCDRVLPRSRFVEELETEIVAWLAAPERSSPVTPSR